MDPRGFLPAHMQTRMQGGDSAHRSQGGGHHSAEEPSQTTTGLERSPNEIASSQAVRGEELRDSDYARQDAGGYAGASEAVRRGEAAEREERELGFTGRGARDTAATGSAVGRDEYTRHDAGGYPGASKAVRRGEEAEQRELGGASGYPAGGSSTQDQFASGQQQDPYARTRREEEARGAGAVAGAGVGALGTRGEDRYAQTAGSDDRTAVGGAHSGGHGPRITGDPEAGFTADRGLGDSSLRSAGEQFDPSLSSTSGNVGGSRAEVGDGQGSLTGGLGGGAAAGKEGLIHGHHTTWTGERLDPHLGH